MGDEEEEPVEEFKVGQLTKEMVVTRLKALGDPCAAAADVVKKTLIVGLKGASMVSEEHGRLISDVCQGGLVGLLLADQSVPKGAVLILHKTAETASELNLDPTEMMRWALKGMVEIKKLIKREELEDVRKAIAQEFMGAGEVFSSYMEGAAPAPAADAGLPPLV